jgi:hypothetical protein
VTSSLLCWIKSKHGKLDWMTSANVTPSREGRELISESSSTANPPFYRVKRLKMDRQNASDVHVDGRGVGVPGR